MDDNIERRAYKPKPESEVKRKAGRPLGSKKGHGIKTGRPSSYTPHVHIPVAKHLTMMGCTEEEIIKACGTTAQTFVKWKRDYPDFLEALKTCNDIIAESITRKLLKKAKGYEYDEVHVTEEREVVEKVQLFNEDGTPRLFKGKPVYAVIYGPDIIMTKRVTVKKHLPPDLGCMAFWLSNRDRNADRSYRWLRQDPPPTKPGQGDDLKTPEAVAQAMMKESSLGMEVV